MQNASSMWLVMAGLGWGAAACSPDTTGAIGGTGPTTSTGSEVGTSPSDASDTGQATTAPDGTATGTGNPAETTVSQVTLVDPNCIDGLYDEAVQADTPDLAALEDAYTAAGVHTFVDQALGLRYPLGQHLVQQAVAKAVGGNCIDMFVGDTSSAAKVLMSLSTIVHECAHMLDNALSSFDKRTYRIRADLDFQCTRPADAFARSLINEDAYGALKPDDSYKDVYLDGDPNDNTFESGDQGYDMLLEEAVQYVNSLATDWTLRDSHGPWTITAKDGILTLLLYVERYLRMARLEYPETYAALTSSTCWREATLTVWGRAWMYLDRAEDDRTLGIDDREIRALVLDPDLLGEIQRLRDAAGCD